MTLTLLLYWFPIFLGVAVGTTLLGGLPRPRGAALAMICAVFWIALVQSHLSKPFWANAGVLFATLAGAGAIAIMGLCGPDSRGENKDGERGRGGERETTRMEVSARRANKPDSTEGSEGNSAAPALAALKQFENWLEAHRHYDDPWADFDEFVRALIYQWVGGTHVRTYRILDSGDQVAPLWNLEPDDPSEIVSARKGIIGYVATTGRSFVVGDPTQGTLIKHLAETGTEVGSQQSEVRGQKSEVGSAAGSSALPLPTSDFAPTSPGPAWCFAVSRRAARIGIVAVGHLGTRPSKTIGHRQREHLRLAELLINHFWNALIEVDRGRAAITTDPGSGVLTRKAFFEFGAEAVRGAHRAGEPVAVAILAMEGVRSLDDDGQWDSADDIRATVSGMLKNRLRVDDRIGRFDDSRFVLLLRRVDSELAQLIMRELMGHLAAAVSARKPYSERVSLRCGLAGTGVRADPLDHPEPSLRRLVTSAVEACGEARRASRSMASDLVQSEL